MSAFTKSMLALAKAVEELEQLSASQEAKSLFMHLGAIHFVTVIECYFRDSLDAIFRLCRHEVFTPALGKLVKQKYSIQELVELEAEGLHILQIIPREMRFQSIEQISGAFDNFFPAGFIKEIRKRQYRFKGLESQIMEVNDKVLTDVAKLFSSRHELVHNPDEKYIRSAAKSYSAHLGSVWNFVFCANQTIEDFIGDNLKSNLRKKG